MPPGGANARERAARALALANSALCMLRCESALPPGPTRSHQPCACWGESARPPTTSTVPQASPHARPAHAASARGIPAADGRLAGTSTACAPSPPDDAPVPPRRCAAVSWQRGGVAEAQLILGRPRAARRAYGRLAGCFACGRGDRGAGAPGPRPGALPRVTARFAPGALDDAEADVRARARGATRAEHTLAQTHTHAHTRRAASARRAHACRPPPRAA